MRVLLLYTGFGGRWDYFRPRMAGIGFSDPGIPAGLEPAAAVNLALTPESLMFEGSALAPLADYASRMTILEGLSMENSLFENSPIVGHERSPAAFFTGGGPRETPDGNLATGPSMEFALGERLGGDTAQRSLRLGIGARVSTSHYDTIGYDNRGDRLPGLTDPRATFEALFRGFVGEGEEVDESALRQGAQDRAVVDALLASAARLRGRLSGTEEAKLTQHMDALSDIERRLGVGEMPGPVTCGEPTPPVTNPAATGTSMNDHTDVMLDIVAQAFACDRTRYVSAVWGANVDNFAPWLLSDVDDWHNQVAHVVDADDAQGAQAVRWMAELQRYYATSIAGFMERLDDIDEGDGTVLDNTLIVWGQDFGIGAHTGVNVPYVLLGGAKNRLNMGRYISYYDPQEDPLYFYAPGDPASYRANNHMFTSIMQAAGVEEEEAFGGIAGTLDDIHRG